MRFVRFVYDPGYVTANVGTVTLPLRQPRGPVLLKVSEQPHKRAPRGVEWRRGRARQRLWRAWRRPCCDRSHARRGRVLCYGRARLRARALRLGVLLRPRREPGVGAA